MAKNKHKKLAERRAPNQVHFYATDDETVVLGKVVDAWAASATAAGFHAEPNRQAWWRAMIRVQAKAYGIPFPTETPAPVLEEAAAVTRKPAASKAPASKPAPKHRPETPPELQRERRTDEELEGDTERLFLQVKATPGKTSEELVALFAEQGVETTTAKLKRPIQRLKEAGRIGQKGRQRYTKYHPLPEAAPAGKRPKR